jgi:drug/metabolite transporter (DMT)-like permease
MVSNMNRYLGIFCAILCPCCWGGVSAVSKQLLSEAAPIPLLVVQLMGSVAFLWSLVLVGKIQRFSFGQMFKWSLPGTLDPGTSYIALMYGLSLSTAGKAALLVSIQPPMTMLLAWYFLREALPRGSAHGLSLAAIGTMLTLEPGTSADNMLAGDLLILLNVLLAAAYSVTTRPQLEQAHPLLLAALHQSTGLLLIAGFWLASFGMDSIASLPDGSTLVWGVLSGIVQYGLCLWCYLEAVKRLSVSLASAFLILIPPVGILSGALLLGESLSFITWIGAVLILGGVSCLREGNVDYTPMPSQEAGWASSR